MKEESTRGSSQTEGTDQLMRLLVRDLAELARAQAKLTTDLVQFLDRIDGPEGQFALQIEEETADSIPREEARPNVAPEPVSDEAGDPGPVSPPAEVPPVPGVERAPEAKALPRAAEIGKAPAEPEEEERGSEGQSATILVLESGNARVGVLWNQVVQIGSIQGPTVPERIETDHGPVDLVSLGCLLHGISREERYFVVVAHEGEKAAVAFERMLGLGPIDSAVEQDQDQRIQVLQVGLLKSFAMAPPKVADGDGREDAQRKAAEEEERDRKGPRRALVAVRYLPARVAICRFLRGRGWQVGEAAGLEAAIVSLDLGRWDALFLEARANGNPDEAETALLNRVGELGVPVIRVGSRISGYPSQGGPALMFPFSENELESILAVTEEQAGS